MVSADIRANTSLRIALRMTDAAESADVIDAPDAAYLSRAVPGRALLNPGDGGRQAFHYPVLPAITVSASRSR